jgi:hypothetical protein
MVSCPNSRPVAGNKAARPSGELATDLIRVLPMVFFTASEARGSVCGGSVCVDVSSKSESGACIRMDDAPCCMLLISLTVLTDLSLDLADVNTAADRDRRGGGERGMSANATAFAMKRSRRARGNSLHMTTNHDHFVLVGRLLERMRGTEFINGWDEY